MSERTITTAEELDALPDMTILVDQHGIAWQKFVDECSDQPYWAMDGTKCYQAKTVLETQRRQLTVLWTPTVADEEEFCSDCFAGMGSSEHWDKCTRRMEAK